MEELSVEISAKIDKLKKGIAQSEKEISTLEKKAGKFNKGFSSSVNNSAKSMTKLSKSTANGSSAMLAFSRTVQDAPFGLMGVSNNITNLTEQFGALKTRTGSAGGALKAMLKDLKGFGGITLGISAVTSLLLVFGDKLFKSKDAVKALRQEQDKLNQSLDNYVFKLETVQRANLTGEQNAQKELVNLRLLRSQIEDTTLSINKRKGAIEQLRKKYPDYLKNMSDEKILNGGLKTTYDELTTSILKRAKASASMNQMIENETKLITLRSQLVEVNTKLKEEEKEIRSRTSLNVATGIAQKQLDIDNARIRAKEKIREITGQIQNLELSNIDLEQNVTSLGGVAPEITIPKTTLKPKAIGVDLTGLQKGIQGFDLTNTINKDLDTSLNKVTNSLTEFGIQAGNIIQGGISNTFSLLGEAIGNPLISASDALRRGLGGLISQLGDFLIQQGTAAILAGKLAAVFGTIAGIPAGIAAIAGGTALKGFGSGLANSGSGGISNNTDTGNFNNSGLTRTFGGGSEQGSNKVEFLIRGENLWGVLDNYARRRGNLGGLSSI